MSPRIWVLVALGACSPGGAVVVDEPVGPVSTDTLPSTGTPTAPEPTGNPGTETTPEAEAPDYRLPGPFAVDTGTGTASTSCSMRYTRFLPQGSPPSTLVVLAHGFSRSRDQVADLGAHLASWGFAVVTPELCTSDFWDIDHERNGEDLVALGAALSGGAPVAYAGHSAGGLAAFLAASQDPDAVGVLGLDLVDSGDLAAAAAAAVVIPTWGLVGEAEACNEDNNALAAYADVGGARVLRVVGADHCDFESPTDFLCTAFCADGGAPDAAVRAVIEGLSTAALATAAGADPLAEQWWTPGGPAYDQLVAAGAISGP